MNPEKPPENPNEISRRQFIQGAAMATGAMALGCASKPAARTIPARVIGANDKIVFGVVGCGGRGTGHVSELVKRSESDNLALAAVSDLYQRRLTRAKGICKGEGFSDYRELLERKDLDAVVIATPDHWHGKVSMDAMDAGKHVYVEKPMTHTVEQALAVRDAVRRTGKILQVGPQDTAKDAYWAAHDAIGAGKIGKVTWAQASYNRNARTCLFNVHQTIDPTAGPDKEGEDRVNWEMFLGHEWGLAPKSKWNPEHFFRFRKYWPYSGGVATDLLYHKLAPLLIALAGPNGAYPKRVTANGGLYIEKDGRDIPDTFLMTVDYPDNYTVHLVSTLTNDAQLPERIYGKHGTMDLEDSPVLRANGDFEPEFKTANGGQNEARLTVKPRRDIMGNFLDVIRGKEKTLCCNAELGAATMVAIKMGVEAYRKSKTMVWDSEKERVMG